ncbi:SAM-dependent methyltransferase [Methylophilaceae bacterium]|jgi:16S rRNA (cytidine1402-2'-O)-methyltransferase|nr:SAM-dependent methyltransferase [Methylophilaceae bacterium]
MENDKKLETLFLIPSSLDQDAIYDFMVEEQRSKIRDLKYFIVENEKSARKTIKKLKLSSPIQELIIVPHNKNTPIDTLTSYIKPLLEGKNIGLLSDAGVPCVADPGSKIVTLAHQNNIKVVPLVGPSSIILSLMASGFNGQNFRFHGYLPIDKNEKKKKLDSMQKDILQNDETQLFIETPYRNNQLLDNLITMLDEKINLCVATNLTTDEEIIVRKDIAAWRKSNLPDLSKKLCIYLLN